MGGFPNSISSVFKLCHRSVVTCCHEIGIQNICMIKQSFPLNLSIAYYTGIRSPAVKIIPDKWFYHLVLKIRHAVKSIIRNPDSVCCPPGVINLTAAAFLSLCTDPCAQRDSHDIISVLFKKIGSHGTVDATRHPDDNFFHK